MSDPIRTPDDEVTKPGWFYPPFREGWTYFGQTYGRRIENGVTKPGHSPLSVDWNRRTPSGGWLQDLGDPVLAAADGKVAEVDRSEGLVMLDHAGGYRTEYRHMRNITAKVGDRVDRGDQIGEIGDVAGSGRSTAPHLHHVHWRNGKRIPMRFEGQPVRTSVLGSDTKPVGWSPPDPVAVTGPPPKATWKGAFDQSQKRLERADERIAAKDGRIALLTEEARLAKAAADGLSAELMAARAALVECQNATPPDCAAIVIERDAAIADRDRALESLGDETDRAVAAEEVVLAVKRAVGCAA